MWNGDFERGEFGICRYTIVGGRYDGEQEEDNGYDILKDLAKLIGEPVGTKVFVEYHNIEDRDGIFDRAKYEVIALMTLKLAGSLDSDDESSGVWRYGLIHPFKDNSAFEVYCVDDTHLEITKITTKELINRLTPNAMALIMMENRAFIPERYKTFRNRVKKIKEQRIKELKSIPDDDTDEDESDYDYSAEDEFDPINRVNPWEY